MNFTLAPTPFSLSENTTLEAKLLWFFGHYDLRVFVSNKAYVDVGRGSFGAALRLSKAFSGYRGCAATVGQFCDFAATCELLPGGEHQNDNNVNVVFSSITTFRMAAERDLAPSPAVEISIGNAVVVSAGAMILGGVSIGDGALVAANATVTKDVAAFDIVGGLPARTLRPRVPAERRDALQRVRWWDFDTIYLANNLARLQQLAVDGEAQHVYRKPTPRFAIKAVLPEGGPQEVQLLGYLDGENLVGMSAMPTKIRDYLAQITGPGPYQWLANVWEA